MLESFSIRYKAVLQSVIQSYIRTARPVSSRTIAKHFGLKLSPATIRNVMADLEDAGYLTHPHTSAGRIPTSMGYRLYVNNIMQVEKLPSNLKKKIRENIKTIDKNSEYLLTKASEILSMVSNQLGVVIGPNFENAIFEKISLVEVAHDKLLIVLSLQTGIVKSVVVEVPSVIKGAELTMTCEVLNQRLSGLTVKMIRETIGSRLHNVNLGNPEIIRLFIESADIFFQFDQHKIFVGGTKNIVEQPEFQQQDKMLSVIELIEKKDVVVHLFKQASDMHGVSIIIGEIDNPDLSKTFSIVSTPFSFSGHTGTLGIIGPSRMWYPKIVPLVNYTAEIINQSFN